MIKDADIEIEAVIFDYHALVTYNQKTVFEKLSEWSSLRLSPEAIRQKISRSRHLAAFERGDILPEEFYRIIMSMIYAMNKKPTYDEFAKVWGNIFSGREGIDTVLKRLHDTDNLFLSGNIDELRWRYLQKIESKRIIVLLADPSKLTISHCDKCRVPEIRFCLRAMNRTGCLERAQILYFGTDPQHTEKFEQLGCVTLFHDPRNRADTLITEFRKFQLLQ